MSLSQSRAARDYHPLSGRRCFCIVMLYYVNHKSISVNNGDGGRALSYVRDLDRDSEANE